MFFQIRGQSLGGAAVGVVDGGPPRKPAVGVPQSIDGAEGPGHSLGKRNIGVVHASGHFFAAQGQGVQHHNAVAPAEQLFFYRGSGGIVAPAGAAGQYKDVHFVFPL